MRRRRARSLLLALLTSAGIAGALAWLGARAAGQGGEEWVEVRREDLVIGVEVSGTLAAVRSSLLGPPAVAEMGDLKLSFLAPEGAEVRAGTPVVRFDASELERRLVEKLAEQRAADKEVEKRRTSLELGQRDLELRLAEARAKRRKAALKVEVPPELVARNELRQSRLDLEIADREIAYLTERLRLARAQGQAEVAALARRRDRAAARVAEMRQAIARLTVRAPRAGTVVYVADRQGDKPKLGDSIWQNQKVVEIPDLRRMRADGQVDEADAGKLAVGQAVTLRLDAHPEVAFPGRVRAIQRTVQRRSPGERGKVVELDVALDRTDPLRMRPGMRFTGVVEIERVPGALVAPAEAVLATAEGPLVYRRGLLGPAPVRPRLGRRNGRLVEVREGLSAGDRIALRPAGVGS